MGKSTKKSVAKVSEAAAPVPAEKPSKIGKREAGKALGKLASGKKQKTEVKAEKKKVPPPKKVETSSSEDEESLSESEEKASPAKPLAAPKAAPTKPKVAPSNGVKKKVESSDSDSGDESEEEADSDSDSELDAKKKATPMPKAEESSDVSSDESEEEPAKTKPGVQTPIPSNTGKSDKKATKKDSSSSDEEDGSEEGSEESSEDESAEEIPVKTTKKGKDVKMKDASSEKKEPKTPSQSQSSGSKTLFVGNLSYDVDRDQVAEFFEEAGEVVSVRLATSEDGSFKGFGHVEFATEAAAQKAMELNGHDLSGRAVRLDLARERGAYTPQAGRENSSYKKDGQRQGNTIFVKGFDRSLAEDEIRSSLQEHFVSCGEITRVSIPTDYETGASKGIAYIDFSDQDSASKAMELSGSDLGGFALTVDEAKPKSDGGRSGGRGRGSGRGDSGGRGGRFGGRGRGGRGGRDGGGRGGRGRGGRGGRGRPY